MGQPVAVVTKPSHTPGLIRFEANRSLTGMGHERFRSAAEAIGPRPAAELARRLFETGRVDYVHVYQNVATVDLRKGFNADGLQEIIESLYTYYRPGFVPPPLVMPEEEAPVAAAEGAAAAAGAPAVDSRLPAALIERSRLAREKAAAKAAAAAAE
ncbi:MAG: hypothetical protein JWL70_2275 [Acidimicrobiia bacterium]|nr:hypothetical protein [Acidimicrobiia bacterium]